MQASLFFEARHFGSRFWSGDEAAPSVLAGGYFSSRHFGARYFNALHWNGGATAAPGGGNTFVKVGGAWVAATTYVKYAGTWVTPTVYVKVGGVWTEVS